MTTSPTYRLNPGGIHLLTVHTTKEHKPLWGEKLSETEDGGHVRWGHSHDDVGGLLKESGLEVVAEEYISGLVSQKLSRLQFGLTRIHSQAAWGVTLPLRVLLPLDGPLTRATGYPHLSVGVVGRKPA